MFVISGATGNTGSTAAQALLDQGQAVRVIVRSTEKGAVWKAKGADVAVVRDLTDVAALTTALEGATGAYFMLPPDLSSETFLSDSILRADAVIQAAKSARLPHAVLLSSVGAQHHEQTGPIKTIAYLERGLVAAGIPLSAIRPGYFLENILDVMPVVADAGVYPSMILPLDKKIDMVATRDIGLAAAEALLDPTTTAHRIIELRGTETYSAIDIAAALSRALDRDITPVPVPEEAWVPTFLEAGLSQQSAETMAEMHANINNGRIDFLDTNARKAGIHLNAFVDAVTA